MNSNIVPNGPQETITNGVVDRPALLIYAETALVITDLIYMHPASPPATGVVNGFTLAAGRWLGRVASMTFTGTATVIYYNH